MRADALADALRGGAGPAIVCAQAGNVNTGALDPLADIAAAAREAGAWVHVDGAFGLWAAASPSLAHLAAGAARLRLLGDRRAQVAQRPLRLRDRRGGRPRGARRGDEHARRLPRARIRPARAPTRTSCPRRRAAHAASRSTPRFDRSAGRESPTSSTAAARSRAGWRPRSRASRRSRSSTTSCSTRSSFAWRIRRGDRRDGARRSVRRHVLGRRHPLARHVCDPDLDLVLGDDRGRRPALRGGDPDGRRRRQGDVRSAPQIGSA